MAVGINLFVRTWCCSTTFFRSRERFSSLRKLTTLRKCFYSRESAPAASEEFSLRFLEGKHEGTSCPSFHPQDTHLGIDHFAIRKFRFWIVRLRGILRSLSMTDSCELRRGELSQLKTRGWRNELTCTYMLIRRGTSHLATKKVARPVNSPLHRFCSANVEEAAIWLVKNLCGAK